MKKQNERVKLYEGKAKILYKGNNPGTIIQYFKDDATAFNNKKKGVISDKGILNNYISAFIMEKLGAAGIPTHFLQRINEREQLVQHVEIVPLEVIVRNFAAGSLVRNLGIKEGTRLPNALVEFCYKDDSLGDPLVSDEHIITFEWANPFELEEIKNLALRINDILFGMFAAINIKLVDFKLEFGRVPELGGIVLADEISPDSCRLWDFETNQKFDKDLFRHDLGDLAAGYREVARRFNIKI